MKNGKKREKKSIQKETCNMNKDCTGILIRLGAMAMIMFLVIVWANLGNALLSVPWWIYLILWGVFCGTAMKKKACSNKK